MLTITIRQALNDEIEERKHKLYVYRDGETIFYVGKSTDWQRRLQEHLGMTWRSSRPDVVGSLIINNQPESYDWAIDLYTVEECGDWIDDFYGKKRMHEVDGAERVLIHRLCPCMNGTYNSNGSRLPEKYTARQMEDFLEDNAVDYLNF